MSLARLCLSFYVIIITAILAEAHHASSSLVIHFIFFAAPHTQHTDTLSRFVYTISIVLHQSILVQLKRRD